MVKKTSVETRNFFDPLSYSFSSPFSLLFSKLFRELEWLVNSLQEGSKVPKCLFISPLRVPIGPLVGPATEK